MKKLIIFTSCLMMILCLACSESSDLLFGDSTGTLRGTISVKGVSVSGFTVSIGTQTTVSGSDGSYELYDIPRGYQEMEVFHNGTRCWYRDFQMRLPETTQDINIVYVDVHGVSSGNPTGMFGADWLDNCLWP